MMTDVMRELRPDVGGPDAGDNDWPFDDWIISSGGAADRLMGKPHFDLSPNTRYISTSYNRNVLRIPLTF